MIDLTHTDGTPITTKELLDMEEDFLNRILEKYKSRKLPIRILQYIITRRESIEKIRTELNGKIVK